MEQVPYMPLDDDIEVEPGGGGPPVSFIPGDVRDDDIGATAPALDVSGSVNRGPDDGRDGDGDGARSEPHVRRRARPSPRKNIIIETEYKTGHYINGEYESLDYEVVHSRMNIDNRLIITSYGTVWIQISRLIACAVIGSVTALCAVSLSVAIEMTAKLKFNAIEHYLYYCQGWQCMVIPFSIWLAFNIGFGAIAFFMVYMEPVSIGSGIPQIKCYLNGVKIPRCVRLKTLFAKLLGVYASVMAGLPVGKEGPMIHSGAVIAAGFSQGKSSTLKITSPLFRFFREDHEKRDFVACGTAAGVASAFGAPGGGVMFAIEEGASYLHQDLLWRFLFTSFLATMVLKQLLSVVYGHPGELLFSGLLDFGSFDQERIDAIGYEGAAYGLLAVLLGLLGALFVYLNVRISLWRRRCLTSWPLRLTEVLIVALCMVLMVMNLVMVSGDYDLYGNDIDAFILRCRLTPDVLGMTDMLLQTPEASLRSLLHDQPGTYHALPLGLFAVYYYLLTLWTYALPVPSGVFIPSLVAGAGFGRFFAVVLMTYFPGVSWVDPGKFALFGAAGMLAGVVRMAISLTFIIVEAAGVISFGPVLMFVLIISKYVADCFNESLYDAHIELDGIPLLNWRPPPESEHVTVVEVMASPVRCLRTRETAGAIYDLLDSCSHNGFPVVDPPEPGDDEVCPPPPLEPCHSDCSDEEANPPASGRSARRGRPDHYGRYRGLILRSQLVEILKHKAYDEKRGPDAEPVVLYNDDYPRYPSHTEVHMSAEERQFHLNLEPYMNPGCMVVLQSANLPRVYEVFRALLLRHVVVVNNRNQVIGMVTRKDLARYRAGGPILRRAVHRLPVRRPRPAATAAQPLFGVCRHLLARRLEARSAPPGAGGWRAAPAAGRGRGGRLRCRLRGGSAGVMFGEKTAMESGGRTQSVWTKGLSSSSPSSRLCGRSCVNSRKLPTGTFYPVRPRPYPCLQNGPDITVSSRPAPERCRRGRRLPTVPDCVLRRR